MIRTRPIGRADLAPLLSLNNAHATELSPLDGSRLAAMVAAATVARCTADADAFVLAFDGRADYDSPNFLWFRSRYARFLYVDRVVVAPARRRRGIAAAFYEAVEAFARHAGHAMLGCEVNLVPPNPASDRFHAALGFDAVGIASVGRDGKTVRYLARTLTAG